MTEIDHAGTSRYLIRRYQAEIVQLADDCCRLLVEYIEYTSKNTHSADIVAGLIMIEYRLNVSYMTALEDEIEKEKKSLRRLTGQ